eukprot:CAMPEP_0170588434 /NCGR_PEP_ID=MMETSP0224-20130122/10827_1 /TAXON_ID=285029 /ORGANISM="Togula jolla, Strain CCCM 725" /LENGTH=268 /DNA_ID=CAMNT_0010912149 /DNA_START=197 /DNA_END=1000 /DNA_ORIENTATION=+
MVVSLTLVHWSLLLAQRTLAAEVHQVDIPLLALRFVLQPCRLLAAASMVRRVRSMQRSTVDIAFDVLSGSEEAEVFTENTGSILSSEQQAEITKHLPAWCRYRAWQLVYSPDVHGTSMQTFYRKQSSSSCGANIIVVRDSNGHTFGGFSSEKWRMSARGYYGTPECFVFSSHCAEAEIDSEESPASTTRQPLSFYSAAPQPGTVLLWGDAQTFSLDSALTLTDDFRSGLSAPCASFDSPALMPGGPEFVVRSFECWELGQPYDTPYLA